MTHSQPNPAASTTQVHTLESTVQSPVPPNFRAHLERKNWAEMLQIATLYDVTDKAANTKRLDRFLECRTHATFYRNLLTKKLVVTANQCKLRWCPFCQRTKAWKIQQQVSRWLKWTVKPRFITLTLQHTTNTLTEQLLHLNNSFREFRRMKDTKQHVKGGIWFLEVKYYPEKQEYHPHLHLLVEGQWWAKEAVSQAWKTASKGSFIIDIRSIHSTESAADYVAKYATKSAMIENYGIETQLDIFNALEGKRTCGSWGSAKVIKLTAKDTTFGSTRQRICSYARLRDLIQQGDAEASALWEAYVTGKSYDSDITIIETENFADEDFELHIEHIEKQYAFW